MLTDQVIKAILISLCFIFVFTGLRVHPTSVCNLAVPGAAERAITHPTQSHLAIEVTTKLVN